MIAGFVRIMTWNLEWKSPRGASAAGRSIAGTLKRLAPDIACLTETQMGWLPGGHEVSGRAQPRHHHRRKAVLWSRWPLTDVDGDGPAELADLRRWCAATVRTPSGPVRVIGVVIPYAHSNVTYGTGAAAVWEDHGRYLGALSTALARRDRSMPTVVLGDFNQRLDGGRSRVPARLRTALQSALEDFRLPTAELTSDLGYVLDHIAVDGIDVIATQLIPNETNNVRRSDHHGAAIDTTRSASPA